MQYFLLFSSVLIGYAVALIFKNRETDKMSILLSFSGAFLLAITVFELLPMVFKSNFGNIGVFIMLGILLQIFLEFFSKGAEHGHVHIHSASKEFPWILFLSLSIHAFLEGFPISEANNLLWGIILHKIPVAIILSTFFIRAKYKTSIIVSFLLLFALMTPLGNYLMIHWDEIKNYHLQITAVVIGILLHVSTTILFESSRDHRFNLVKLSTIIGGILLAYIFQS